MSKKPKHEDREHIRKNFHMPESEHKEIMTQPSDPEISLSQTIHGMAIPTFVIDREHIVTHWNRACEILTGISSIDMIGTQDAWKAFYPTKRPVLADLVVDGSSEKTIAHHYEGKFAKSLLVDDAYEAQDFFPHLGEDGKWLFFTATQLLGNSKEILGAIETFKISPSVRGRRSRLSKVKRGSSLQ